MNAFFCRAELRESWARERRFDDLSSAEQKGKSPGQEKM